MKTSLGVRILTTALEGVRVVPVEAQVQISSGLPAFNIVGLPDKAVSESRERVRAALYSLGLGLPSKRILINLAPADLPKEGSHYDLPIALGLLAAMEVLDFETLQECLAFGELGLHGQLHSVPGVLPTAMEANRRQKTLICSLASVREARLSGIDSLLTAENLQQLVAYWRDGTPLPDVDQSTPQSVSVSTQASYWEAIRGQEAAKRGLEIAAAGGHSILFCGPPGVGKSMLAQALPEILPPLTPEEALQTALVRSVAGEALEGDEWTRRPFRDPHHTASAVALVGGGSRVRPGEVTLAHNGILFLDELPEFSRSTLEALRQPMETGRAVIARANRRVTFPSCFQLVAAMNPCRCGYLGDAERSCKKAPQCAMDYQQRISGPLWDRVDIHIDVPDVPVHRLRRNAPGPRDEPTTKVRDRVSKARSRQAERYINEQGRGFTNASVSAEMVDKDIRVSLDVKAENLLSEAADKMRISARSWFRMVRVARTIADLEAKDMISSRHMAEALTYRRIFP